MHLEPPAVSVHISRSKLVAQTKIPLYCRREANREEYVIKLMVQNTLMTYTGDCYFVFFSKQYSASSGAITDLVGQQKLLQRLIRCLCIKFL